MSYQITVADTDITFPCEAAQTVLDAAETAGWSIPYSCRKGVCTTCAGGLRTGELTVRGNGTVRGPQHDVLLCRAVPCTDVEITPKRIASRRPPVRKTITATVYRIRRPTRRITLLDLRFPIGLRAPFRAGQYLTVLLPDGDSRLYSLANSPQHNDGAQLHVRTEPGGRFSDTTLATLATGDTLTVELPYGEFSLDPDSDEPVIFLATGTGFAPIKSIIEDQIARRRDRTIHLYWGARDEADLYWGDLAAHWARQQPWFRFTPVLSRPTRTWNGATGWVQHAVLHDHPDLRGHQVYACGNQQMTTEALTHFTSTAELTEDRFHSDAFVPSGDPVAPPSATARPNSMEQK